MKPSETQNNPRWWVGATTNEMPYVRTYVVLYITVPLGQIQRGTVVNSQQRGAPMLKRVQRWRDSEGRSIARPFLPSIRPHLRPCVGTESRWKPSPLRLRTTRPPQFIDISYTHAAEDSQPCGGHCVPVSRQGRSFAKGTRPFRPCEQSSSLSFSRTLYV